MKMLSSQLLKVKLRLFYKLQKMEKTHNAYAATQQGRLYKDVFLWIAPDSKCSISTHNLKAESLRPTMEKMKLAAHPNCAHTASIRIPHGRNQCFSRAPCLDLPGEQRLDRCCIPAGRHGCGMSFKGWRRGNLCWGLILVVQSNA